MAEKLNLAIGGQALIEGVMIRSPHHIVRSVRRPNGKIETDHRVFTSYSKRNCLLGLPIVRGVVNFLEMMVIGMQALNWSSQKALDADDSDDADTAQSVVILIVTVFFSLAIALFVFKYIPLLTTQFVSNHVPAVRDHWIVFNVLDGMIKILVFLVYVVAISQFKDIRRVFQYHGAEHKSIFAYEHDATLTPEHVAHYQKEHPRCGTSFILIVFTVSILVYTLIPRADTFWMNFGIRMAFLPVIAGIAYELLKFAGKYHDTAFGKLLSLPGIWFQYITTQEPDRKQLEVAIATITKALALEQEARARA